MKFPEGLPQVVALKIPNLHDKSPIASRQKLWSSIFKELQILKHESISSHNSIVKLFGVSWRTTTKGGSFLPVFVLEAAQRGDLATFLKGSTGLKLQKGFCLSIDIAAGVQALHELGIIHADLKPQNILIFEDDDRELVAKIADFGSAVFLDDVTLEVQLDAGTSLWQAPECCRPVQKADLVKTDIYSLGLVIANLMTGNYVVELLQQSEHQIQQNGKLSDSIRADISRRVGQMVQESGIELENGEFVIAARTSALIYWATDIPSQRIPRVNKFHKELRSILNHADLDSQEFDILLKPGLGSLSDEDMVQAFKYSRLKTQHEMSQRGSDISPKYIKTTLYRWLGRAKPIVSNGKAIFEASKCFGTLRMMPPAVVREIAKQLSNLAYAPSEDIESRQKAAIEYANMVFWSLQFYHGYESSVESALDAMYLSAELGNPEAQGITIWLFEAFGHSLPPEHTCEKTIQWLSTALKYGSETSLRHLKLVSSNVYQIARRRLRTHGGGIGQDGDLSHIWTFIDTGFDMAMSILKDGSSDPNLEMAVYQSAVLSGRVDLMCQVLQAFTRGANHEFQLRESVLLYACRAGYEEMTHFLLDNGADPSKTSAEGATPLHFLSSFDDSCMRDIAKKLLSNGALLEARTTNAASHRLVLDSTFGKVNGTPLTWAVAANSQTAVSVLIALGADPFDRLSRKAPVGDRWGTLHHLSPVMYAAMTHHWAMLGLLLPKGSTGWVSRFKYLFHRGPRWELNHGSRPIGSWGDRDTSTLIEVCARYAIPGSLQRILIHGKEHEEAFRKTFELLISAGCDPCKATKRRHNLWVAAIQWGQPFVVRHLMDWQGGRLRPDNEEWLAYLMTAVGLQDTVTCDVLLEFAKLYSVPETQWAAFFTELVQTTDDSDVLDRFKHHLASNTDHGEAVGQALLHGNFTSARWVYTNARCDIVNAHLDGASCLGKLVLRSKTHSHAAIAVRELLEFYELPTQLFENVFELGGSSFTALHLAALHLEYMGGSQMAGSVFQELLEVYNEPDHLNFKIKAGNYKGCTPLHIAVATCNIPAVKLLLAEEDVRINDTGPDDKTAMDLALQNFSNQDKDLDLWKVVSHKRQGSDLSHFLQAFQIYQELRDAGVTSNKVFAAVVRTDEDNYTIMRSGAPDMPVIMFKRK
ncbi:serine threonine kinase [Fusarium mexicanum]|uniref:Autophagy-related protein 1 n=1 Tax=Fusarium mexicanum TaxID=751941 RepID=A0A8H5IG45_9HYPO|nr:serine threonine kinase [Fusarium mexicanum]